ncbi:MAG: hypothetical protein RQ741_13020 [Wenzhouxiangellaceae bacterium]|nr:hypothetical protein [Wenzhouxiangellaceae bacterium]
MKKWLLIIIVLLVCLGGLALPAAIGWWIEDRATQAVAENRPEADLEWHRGWFRSNAKIRSDEVDLDLQFRHFSMQPPGWLAVNGRALLREPLASVDFSAHLDPTGDTVLNASAPSLEVPGDVAWHYRRPEIDLNIKRDSGIDLSGRAERLFILDAVGNRLVLDRPDLAAEWHEISGPGSPASDRGESNAIQTGARVQLTIRASRPDQPASRLDLAITNIDPATLEQLLAALRQIGTSQAGSAAAGLGAIGAASAWQQLAAKGIQIRVTGLELDGQLMLSGAFLPQTNRLEISGEGAESTLLDWWAIVLGLTRRLPPEQARQMARIALDELSAGRESAIERDRRRNHIMIDFDTAVSR